MDKQELYRLSKVYSNLFFYLKGEIIYIDINKDGVIITIDFCTPGSRKIKFTKRMITGSLIILTDNNYENYLLTTVFYNPYVDIKLNKKNKKQRIKIPKFPYYRVQLSLANIGPESFAFLIKNRKNLQIFESKAYFESYIHVLKRLKEINIIDLPFEEELINSNFKNLLLPKIEENYCYIYNEYKLNPYKKEYPIQFINLLDDSQLNAVRCALLSKIALIQGPPGTGKTHVGTIIANILLQNLNPESQILVVCYTNHALDSFIENILKYTDDVVRIGGRCKNEKVQKKALNSTQERYASRTYRGVIHELEQMGIKMKNFTSLVDVRKRLDIQTVKRQFKTLYQKVINDIFEIISGAIPINWKLNLRQYLVYEPKIENQIYKFWNTIGHKKSNPREIILSLLDYVQTTEEVRDYLFITIYKNFEGYDNDNILLLKQLNNFNNNNEILNNINMNLKEEEEEEEEEDD